MYHALSLSRWDFPFPLQRKTAFLPTTTDGILALCSTAWSTFFFLLLQNQDSLLQPGYVMPFSFPPSTRWSVHITSPDSGAYLLSFSIPLQFEKLLPTSQDHLPSFLFPPPRLFKTSLLPSHPSSAQFPHLWNEKADSRCVLWEILALKCNLESIFPPTQSVGFLKLQVHRVRWIITFQLMSQNHYQP